MLPRRLAFHIVQTLTETGILYSVTLQPVTHCGASQGALKYQIVLPTGYGALKYQIVLPTG